MARPEGRAEASSMYAHETPIRSCRSAQSQDATASRTRSPVFRAGVFMPAAATVQPALLARGLRRVLLERGVRILERTTAGPVVGGRGEVEVGLSATTAWSARSVASWTARSISPCTVRAFF